MNNCFFFTVLYLFLQLSSLSYQFVLAETTSDACPTTTTTTTTSSQFDVKTLSPLDYVNYLKLHNSQQEWIDQLLSPPSSKAYIHPTYDTQNCEDQSPECPELMQRGDCIHNPAWMIFNCGKTCQYCHLINQNIRCQRNPIQLPSLQFGPGTITRIMNRAIQEYSQYKPRILSRDPWIVEFHNVFTATEARRLINLGRKHFARSQDAGQMKDDGTGQFEAIISNARTSSTYWCVNNCWKDPMVQRLVDTAENITLIPRHYSEYIQVLKYEPGQYYVEHHDFIKGHLDLPIGPRIFTYFMYLSDVEEGGGTRFTHLNITVEPKLGKVILWPSVLDEDPFAIDWRTYHEALPVAKGVKYAANFWLHMYNFHAPFQIMCTG